MPAGRPVTTGGSVHVTFRAKGPLGPTITSRRTFPDLTNDYLAAQAADRTADKRPAPGAVASRDLHVYYTLLRAELADAAAVLTYDQAAMMLSAIWSLAVDSVWITNAPELLASEIEDDYADDETGPDDDRKALAATVRTWPRLRALAVLEVLLSIRDNPSANHDVARALEDAGLVKNR